ncbi:FKBP-type peptidyl-prolyl cis-trans isomerase [Flavicella marina]|uniref:FKBP-type peptidyl-prolyl cis-trans isomerase n=1 Tax=Flavicella marina TaxID=1475951 RepID=UPI00126433AC|nr:hypothetical protein [Flavicella marina]
MNSKNTIYLLAVLFVISISCDKGTNELTKYPFNPFDHEAQLQNDQDSILLYLDTHYFNTNDNVIWSIDNDEEGSLSPENRVPLNEDPKLDSIQGIETDGTLLDYKMYYYIFKEGIDNGNVGHASPSRVDSVLVTYSAMLLDSTVFDVIDDEPIWLPLYNTIQGFSIGLTKLKKGTSTIAGNENVYNGSGEGYLIFPSGLGYAGYVRMGIPSNSPLIFKVTLDDVKLIDTDLDLVPTKFELSFDDGLNIIADDFDGDGIEDYRDEDDDNDFSTTRDEVLDEFTARDARGNIDFPYDEDGRIEGVNGGLPNYKNSDIHLED